MNILITGATGLIGKEVGKVLAEQGHRLFALTRHRAKALEQLPFPAEIIEGDLSEGPVLDPRLAEIEAVIHLAGESVAGGRWTPGRKKAILESRERGTRHLRESLSSRLEVIVAASATGFYGDRGEESLAEGAAPGADFLAEVCVAWEAAVAQFPCRHVMLRTGIVLSDRGGALEKMLFPFRAGLGGAIGKGDQWMSWIDLRDLVRLYVWALGAENVRGIVNAVSPHPVTNRSFSQCLARSLGRSLGPSVPALALKAIYGEFGEVLLASQKVLPTVAKRLDFQFQYENLEKSLNDINGPLRNGEEIFYAEQFLPLKPEEVFPFFSAAANLEKITPPSLNFHIASMSTPAVEQGTLIEYKLRVHGLPMRWLTEIQEWRPPRVFVDNQLKGPYRLWHHTHEFREFAGGTLMCDRVRYRLPAGYLGWLAGGAFVRGDVEKIFAFRRKYIADNLKTLVSASE